MRSVMAGVFILALSVPIMRAEKPDWQKGIDWAVGNTGEPNCKEEYVKTEPKCLVEGNRSCLMARAIDSAKHDNYAYAMRLTLITQCHNGGAQKQLGEAGQKAIGDYLKTK